MAKSIVIGTIVLASLVKMPCLEAVENPHSYSDASNHYYHPSNPQELLYQGIFNESPEEILAAIAYGAEVNKKDEGGWTPLVIAVLTQKPIAIEVLLKQGANARILHEGKSLMYHVSDAKSATALVMAGADFLWVTEMNYSAIDKALWLIDCPIYPQTQEDGIALLEAILDRGYPINGNRSNHQDYEKNALYSLLHDSHLRDQGLVKALRVLIERGASVNQVIITCKSRNDTITPLMLAILRGEKAVKMLLHAGADVNLKANPHPHEHIIPLSPLQYAQRYSNGSGWASKGAAIEFLLKHGARF